MLSVSWSCSNFVNLQINVVDRLSFAFEKDNV